MDKLQLRGNVNDSYYKLSEEACHETYERRGVIALDLIFLSFFDEECKSVGGSSQFGISKKPAFTKVIAITFFSDSKRIY